MKAPKRFATKIIRVKRKEAPAEKKTAITSKFASQNGHILSDRNDATSYGDQSISDFISDDAGMRMLHRSSIKQPKESDIEYDFIHKHVKTVVVKSATSVDKSKPEGEPMPRVAINTPKSVDCNEGKKVEMENLKDEKVTPEQIEAQLEKCTENGKTRFNEMNMQMLSRRLYKQVFSNSDRKDQLPHEKLKSLREALAASGMNVGEVNCLPDVHIELPTFEGKDVEEHFYNIAKDQTKQYLKIIHDATKACLINGCCRKGGRGIKH